jgi:hypothetical protein
MPISPYIVLAIVRCSCACFASPVRAGRDPPTSERHGAVGAGTRVLHVVREQICLAELRDAERVAIPDPADSQALTAWCRRETPSRCVPTTITASWTGQRDEKTDSWVKSG